MLIHIKSVLKIDSTKLNSLLEQIGRSYLQLLSREMQQLRELVSLLQPFLEATLKTQGDKVSSSIEKDQNA